MRIWRWFRAWMLGVSVRVKIMRVALGMLLLGFALTIHVHVGLAGVLGRGATADTIAGSMLLATLLISIVGVVAAYGLTRVLTQPLLELREAACRAGAGEFGARAPVRSRDEIGHTGKSLGRRPAWLWIARSWVWMRHGSRRRWRSRSTESCRRR